MKVESLKKKLLYLQWYDFEKTSLLLSNPTYLCPMLRQNLDHIATLLYETGVRNWAISPGSRNAPIVAGLIRHGGFELYSFPDERCAAFAALGMAQATGYTCGVICTSGTAVLNLYPAICEAYYQRVPLLAITADRPEELIDQWDGQTIHQKNIFEKHILRSFETAQDLDAKNHFESLEELVYEAVETSIEPVKGPVHINIPLRDPIYADLEEPFNKNKPKKHFVFLQKKSEHTDVSYLHAELSRYKKILFVCGQNPPDAHLEIELRKISKKFPLLCDITGNQNASSIQGWEMGMQTTITGTELQPDLLITFGLSVVSKKLKQFLRTFPPAKQWHIASGGFTGDPFGTEPETKQLDPAGFLHTINTMDGLENKEYLNAWIEFGQQGLENAKKWPVSGSIQRRELELVRSLLSHCDHSVTLQLGNSLTVRYAGWAGETSASVFCNRGTSGIDGSLSTAVGYALAHPEQKVLCILGDVSFFYDSNAFWTNTLPQNLTIIIVNNGGGRIFEFIEGPEKEKALKPFIQTPHHYTAKNLAAHYNIPYHHFNIAESPDTFLPTLSADGIRIVEFMHN